MDVVAQIEKESRFDVANGDIDLDGVLLRMAPQMLDVNLVPQATDLSLKRFHFRWQTVGPASGATLMLHSDSETYRFVRLRVEDWGGIDPKWARWSYEAQHTPELEGGYAVDTQDRLADDASELDIILVPNRTRRVVLEIKPTLTRRVEPGDYQVRVVVQDVGGSDGRAASLPLLVRLRHPDSSLLRMLPAAFQDAAAEMQRDLDGYEKPFFERYLRGFDDFIDVCAFRCLTRSFIFCWRNKSNVLFREHYDVVI